MSQQEETGFDFTVDKVDVLDVGLWGKIFVFRIEGKELRLSSKQVLSPTAFRKRFLEVFCRIPKLPKGESFHDGIRVVMG